MSLIISFSFLSVSILSTENASVLRIHDLSATFAVTSFLLRVMEWVKPNVPQTTLYHPFLLFIFTQILYFILYDRVIPIDIRGDDDTFLFVYRYAIDGMV